MARLDSFLRLVVEQNASDLHFMAGSRPTIRHNGNLVAVPFRQLSSAETRRFLAEVLSEAQMARLDAQEDIDFAYVLPGIGRFRTNVFTQRGGLGAVFRVIPEQPPRLEDLALPSATKRLFDFKDGLILFTGPTGCGKSTTQAAIVNEFNRSRPWHIVTIEDPIEFLHPPQRSLFSQRQVGRDVASFEAALRSALRESPDVVLVGEMRDLETIRLAISAAETGVLVLGTLHTGSAAKSVDRIVDAFPEAQGDQIRGVLSAIVRAVVSQRLVKRASGDGRLAALELLFVDTGIANMIREGKTHLIDAMLQTIDPRTGMQSLDRHLLKLVGDREVTLEEARKHSAYPQMFEEMARQELGEDHWAV